jgi:hypothetical protein
VIVTFRQRSHNLGLVRREKFYQLPEDWPLSARGGWSQNSSRSWTWGVTGQSVNRLHLQFGQ